MIAVTVNGVSCCLCLWGPDWAGRWALELDSGAASLEPSVYNRQTCGAHYFIRLNRVIFV